MIFLFIFFYLNIIELVYLNIFSILIYIYAIFGLGIRSIIQKNDRFIGWLVFAELIGSSVTATYYLGAEAGFQYYMYTLIFMPFFTWSYCKYICILRMLIVIIIILTLEYWGSKYAPLLEFNSNYLTIFHYLNLVLFLTISASISYFYAMESNVYLADLFQNSNTDILTNLYNRRYVNTFHNATNKLFYTNNNLPHAFLLIDIDDFKIINDLYGHKYGDDVLIKVAQLLKKTLHNDTIISRWGGEEFLIILENMSKNELETLAEELRVIIEKTPMVLEKEIYITVTLGGSIADEDDTFDTLLNKADTALYKGKKNGRNQVVIL